MQAIAEDENNTPKLLRAKSDGSILLSTEHSETQIFEDEEIRDTNAHNSAIGDCRYFNIITIWVENGLDKNVSVQVKGNRVNSVTDAVDIGDAFDVVTVDRESRTMKPNVEGFLPYIFIEVTAAVMPTTGDLNAYLIKKPI